MLEGPDLAVWDSMQDAEQVAFARAAAESSKAELRFDRLERFACGDQQRMIAIGFSERIGGEVVLIPSGVLLDARVLNQDQQVEERMSRLPRPIWVARTELTVAQWDRLTGSRTTDVDALLPVTSVDWTDVVRACAAAGGRLLLPGEWEYVARGGVHSLWCVGDTHHGLREYSWFFHDSRDRRPPKLHPVATKLPNGFGVFDMHGNAAELVWSGIGHYGGTGDPVEAEGDAIRVAMGGSDPDEAKSVTCSSAELLTGGTVDRWVGVRICFDVNAKR